MKTVNYFKALADETRLRLVHIFMHYELNVNEIVAVMQMGQSRISRHLKILTDSGLLTSRRDGLWTFYTAAGTEPGRRLLQSCEFLFGRDTLFADDLDAVSRLLKRRAEESVRFFDSIAEDWEKLKREIIGDVDINRLIMNVLPQSGTVLDLGCGTGDLLEQLKNKAAYVIGVDKSSKMLDEARRRFAGDGKNIDMRLGQLEHLPLREGEADLAVINMVMHHIPEPRLAIREVHRVLKPGDRFIIVDLLKHDQELMRERYGDRWLGFSKDQMETWLDDAGFTLEHIDLFDLKKNIKGFIIRSVKK